MLSTRPAQSEDSGSLHLKILIALQIRLLLMSRGEVNPESWTQLDVLHRLGYQSPNGYL